MNKQQEALRLALEDLQDANGMAYSEFSVENLYGETITAIREALAEDSSDTEQPAQQHKLADYEPDGMHHNKPHKCKYPKCPYPCPDLPDCRDAEQPARKPWVGLTEFDIDQIPYSCSHADSRLIAYAIEAKLREKNA